MVGGSIIISIQLLGRGVSKQRAVSWAKANKRLTEPTFPSLPGSLCAPPAPTLQGCACWQRHLTGHLCQVELQSGFYFVETSPVRTNFDKGLLLLKEAEGGAHPVSCQYTTTTQMERQAKCLSHQIQQPLMTGGKTG